jgi:BirA family biotin operon repressor/biotin-[acetyl-CoA-carboxylase] ligase
MPIIKVDAIDSTNSFLKKLNGKQFIEDFTVVVAKHQTQGRGQMGANWVSESSKNLTFSVFVDVSAYSLNTPFYLSMATALAVRAALSTLLIPKLNIKWPNDILSRNKKLCGILIENVIKKAHIQHAVIGIGLNVNQTVFTNLPKASSLRNVTGRNYNLDKVLEILITALKQNFSVLKAGQHEQIKLLYETHLFRKHKPSTFKDAEGNLFSGIIKGVSSQGALLVLLENQVIKAFTLKELTLLY